MIIRIMYHDRKHDVVNESLLQQLIEEGKVMKFYRPSEGWVSVGRRPVRGRGGVYHGPERRKSDSHAPAERKDVSE